MVNYNYLRPVKAETMKEWYKNCPKKEESLSYKSYYNATVLPLKKMDGEELLWGRGGVVCGNEYIEASGYPGRQGGFYQEKVNTYKDEKVVFCGYFVYHWGHFLMESTSRLWYALRNDTTIDRYIFLCNSGRHCEILGNYREFMELLGIYDKVELVCEPIRYREVVIPDISYQWDRYYCEEFKDVFQFVSSQALDRVRQLPKIEKIFFSRTEFNKEKKSEIGLEMLDNFFLKNGFKLLYPERMPLSELIYYINYAKVVGTTSGTLPHNLLFGQNGKKVIIVERQPWINEYQVNVDKIMSLDVDYIDGNLFIYPVHISAGPFLYHFNKYFQNYAQHYGYVFVDIKYNNEKYLKKSIRNYLSLFFEKYNYEWSLYEWLLSEKEIIFEGYRDSYEVTGRYISGKTPFCVKQFFGKKYINDHLPNGLKKALACRYIKISFWLSIPYRVVRKIHRNRIND